MRLINREIDEQITVRSAMRSRDMATYSLVFLLLFSIFSDIYMPETHLQLDDENEMKIESISKNNNLIDIPTWKIADTWNYNGYLDLSLIHI